MPMISHAALAVIPVLVATSSLLNVAPSLGHPRTTVVPEHENLVPAPGSAVTQGVLAVKRLGGQPLEQEFSGLRGRELRVRELIIAPGGTIALHRHDQRPGVAYILEGQMTERRHPGFAPLVVGPGEAAFEASGVTHWWRNAGHVPARVLVVDIVPLNTP
jgi:quercetin dioxygenase-like cupin family protein